MDWEFRGGVTFGDWEFCGVSLGEDALDTMPLSSFQSCPSENEHPCWIHPQRLKLCLRCGSRGLVWELWGVIVGIGSLERGAPWRGCVEYHPTPTRRLRLWPLGAVHEGAQCWS